MSSSAASADARPGGGLSRRVIVLLALTCGVAVGNIYFPQAVSPLVASGLGVALFLTGPEYGRGAQAVGVLALVSAATMFCTPLTGRQVDRRGCDPVGLAAMLGTLASAGVLAFGALGGAAGLVALAAGTLLLDVAMQSGTIANQARIFALRPDARSRINTAYMTCSFLGGSTGSWLGAAAYGRFGWTGVCVLLAVLAAVALARHLLHRPGGAPGARDGVAGVAGNAQAKSRS